MLWSSVLLPGHRTLVIMHQGSFIELLFGLYIYGHILQITAVFPVTVILSLWKPVEKVLSLSFARRNLEAGINWSVQCSRWDWPRQEVELIEANRFGFTRPPNLGGLFFSSQLLCFRQLVTWETFSFPYWWVEALRNLWTKEVPSSFVGDDFLSVWFSLIPFPWSSLVLNLLILKCCAYRAMLFLVGL